MEVNFDTVVVGETADGFKEIQHKETETVPLDNKVVYFNKIEESSVFECKRCQFKTLRFCSLQRHLKMHEYSQYCCPVCYYKTKYKLMYSLHKATHSSDKIRSEYECSVCNYASKTFWGLKGHELGHGSPLQCNQCLYKCDSVFDLKLHYKKTHSDKHKLDCKYCAFVTKSRKVLQKHVEKHETPEQALVYKCSMCSFVSLHRYEIFEHYKKHSKLFLKKTDEIDLAAYTTSTTFPSSQNQKVLKCKLCEFQTVWRWNLLGHSQIHKIIKEEKIEAGSEVNMVVTVKEEKS